MTTSLHHSTESSRFDPDWVTWLLAGIVRDGARSRDFTYSEGATGRRQLLAAVNDIIELSGQPHALGATNLQQCCRFWLTNRENRLHWKAMAKGVSSWASTETDTAALAERGLSVCRLP